MKNTTLYIHCPKWFIRPRNTDWRYTRFTLPRMSEYASDLRFVSAESIATMARANLRCAENIVRQRLGIRASEKQGIFLDQREFRNKRCDLVFCHDDFPRGVEGIPVVWQNSILDPVMRKAYGADDAQLRKIAEEKRKGFEAAALVHVSTEAERERLGQMFPGCADRFAAVPFFLPDVQGISAEALETKLAYSGPLRCLFVGGEARRKGLERVYAAVSKLNPSLQSRVQLTVVSAETDGRIDPPKFANLRRFQQLPHGKVLELMRESDVLLVPSFYESYGLVYIEAMSQGTIPVVPDWEVQREIVDYGRAGVITSGDPSELCQWIERLWEDRQWRNDLARKARERFERVYAPAAVARTFRASLSKILPGVDPDLTVR